MIRSKNQLYRFRDQIFEFEDATRITGLSGSSMRNILSELVNEGIITTQKKKGDQRKRTYALNWQKIVQKLKNPDSDSKDLIQQLGLEKWAGKHIALQFFQVIDSDESLMALINRFWDKTPDPDIAIITIGTPKDVFRFGFNL